MGPGIDGGAQAESRCQGTDTGTGAEKEKNAICRPCLAGSDKHYQPTATQLCTRTEETEAKMLLRPGRDRNEHADRTKIRPCRKLYGTSSESRSIPSKSMGICKRRPSPRKAYL